MTIFKNKPAKAKTREFLRQLRDDRSGLAIIEFAISLPFFLTLSIGGFEMANYAQTLMKLNQITIHTADSAARMGEGDILAAQEISEAQINDVFAGTIREGETLLLDGEHEYKDPSTDEVTLRGNARIILSSFEEAANFDPDDPKYRIRWQRCIGSAITDPSDPNPDPNEAATYAFNSNYGDVDTTTEVDGIGPEGRQVIPPRNTAVMFVELQYYFRPLLVNGFSRLAERTITQTASMVVRDRRNYQEIYNREGVNVSICNGAGGGDDYVEFDGT